MSRSRLTPLLLSCAVIVLTATSAWAARNAPTYRYGEKWWEEYIGDQETALLLHFGKPHVTAHGKLAAKVVERKRGIDDLLEADDDQPTDMDLPQAKVADPTKKTFTVDDSDLKPGQIQDYGIDKRRYNLPAGVSLVPSGRFGKALRCDGKAAFVIKSIKNHGLRMMECFFKVDRYPAKTACILSINKDDGRLLLHPDGKVELKRKHAHGRPKAKAERLKLILARDASIIGKSPVPVGKWVHVIAYTHLPVVQGMEPPHHAILKVNGQEVAKYESEPQNKYNFMAASRGPFELRIGNNADGTQGFEGLIDEVRLSTRPRYHYPRRPLRWRDAEAKRALQFGEPQFFQNSSVFHASLDRGHEFDFHRAKARTIETGLKPTEVPSLAIDGVRGKGWQISPEAGNPRFSLKGMSAEEGALEFWIQPLNWDDVTGYWHHTPPPQRFLSVARFYGLDAKGKPVKFMEVRLERAHNNERSRVPLEPGRWIHVLVNWNKRNWKYAEIYRDGKKAGGTRRAAENVLKGLKPAYVEFGVASKVTVARDQKPRIAIDEIVGHASPLSKPEIKQAYLRCQRELEPLSRHTCRVEYRWSIGTLLCTAGFHPRPEHTVKKARITVFPEAGEKPMIGPIEGEAKNNAVRVTLQENKPLKPGTYRFLVEALGEDGKAVITGKKTWKLKREPWRDNQAGIIKETPAPWTSVERKEQDVKTRMTTWRLGTGGLPDQILAAGCPLLAAPIRLLEDGQPMQADPAKYAPSADVELSWTNTFRGKTCDIEMKSVVEYDGLLKLELRIKPKGKVARLSMQIPFKSERATHAMYNVAGAGGAHTLRLSAKEGTLLASTLPSFWRATWQAKRRKKPAPKREDHRGFAFLTQLDISDAIRGLYWFADNARGWWQSKKVDTHEVVRRGEQVEVNLNLIAEPVELKDPAPIVFGLLPHPARPLPKMHRLLDRIDGKKDPKLCSAYGNVDMFVGMSKNPRDKTMALYPGIDPKKKEDGPSWEHAESVVPNMAAERPFGIRTMYLSRYWFSCRAGAYDGWEWRCGPSGQAMLGKSMVDYLCWEINEWVRRGIYEAIYLDECYDVASRNVKAGHAVVLPDGSVQPGQTLWGFRDMMKRWRNIFHQHGKEPLLLSHLTGSFQYCGLVFCDSYLDGENRPIISAHGRDFVERVALHRAEVIQNGALWGLTSFYMPAIWEKGFGQKESNPHKRWSWRMARAAHSLFAHFEVACTYTGQGASVYRDYWNDVLKWGAGDLSVPFHSYLDNAKYLKVDGQGKDALVSFYKKGSRLLLIASNRKKQERELKITLDHKALGLPEKLTVKTLDTGHVPAKGLDILSRKAVKKEAAESMQFDLGEDDPEDDLMDAEVDTLVNGEKEARSPRFEKGVLVLPVRARDFLMVAIEP